MKNEIFCSICGLSNLQDKRFTYNSKYGNNLCNKHYVQLKRYGKTFDITKFDKNQVEYSENFIKIILRDINNNINGEVKIDFDDFKKIENYKWYLGKDGYAICKNKDGYKRMHLLILNNIEGYITDHINRDRLDNRKSNLRNVTFSQNGMNKSIQSNNTSGYVGVRFREDRNKWQSYIMVNQKMIYLGNYILLEDAINARKNAEDIYFKEYKSNIGEK